MTQRKTEQDYYDMATKRGFCWLGPFPPNNRTKSLWECSSRHQWMACYSNIQQGYGCPYCSGHARIIKKDYFTLAEKSNLIWLGKKVPKTTHTKSLWHCKKCYHEWKARYDNLKQGRGCPNCAGRIKKTSQDYLTLAKEKGFEWIDTDAPQNTCTKTGWQCSNNHIWQACYTKIQAGRGCPCCANVINGVLVSKIQMKIARMLSLEKYVNYQFDNSKRRIDIAIPWEKIAIEYDSWYWHATKIEYDRRRAQDLINLGWRVLAIKSGYKMPSQEMMMICIKQLDETNYIELVLADWGCGNIFNRTQKG